MAVQAQYPSNALLPETSWTRMRNLLNGLDEKNTITPPILVHGNTAIEEFRMHYGTAAAGASNPFLFSPPYQVASCGVFHTPENDPIMWIDNTNNNNCRKRLRESAPELADYLPFGVYQSNGAAVSTGLRLNIENDIMNNPSGTELDDSNNTNNISVFSALNIQSLGTELQRQRDEIDEYMRLQGEQVRQGVEEKTQRHAKALLCAVVEGVSRKLREKDVEVVNMKRRNMELEEKLKEVMVESRAWQMRAKSNEAMVNLLRMNIEQTSRQQKSREGCGDSEEEAASCQIMIGGQDDDVLERRCRICSGKEVSILLLPCLHVCLCKDCENEVETCPICNSSKSTAVQVYFS